MAMTIEMEREAFEKWYVENAFDYEANPLGSRDCGLQWKSWQAARTQPAPLITDEAVERLAQHIYEQEARNRCKTLDEAVFHRSKWRRAIPEARAMLEATFPVHLTQPAQAVDVGAAEVVLDALDKAAESEWGRHIAWHGFRDEEARIAVVRTALAALAPAKVYVCTGCDREANDPGADLAAIQSAGGMTCCPERNIVERPTRALAGEKAEDACYHRCKRIHPHCQLRITRDGAPDTGWHWAVTMPDGHLYDISHGRMTFEQALADMQTRGIAALDAADTIWRKSRPTPPTDGEE